MTCSQVRQLLPGYLDGALPESAGPVGHARMGKHLEKCAACRQELKRYVEISMVMAGVKQPPPPPDLGVAIRVALAKARAEEGFAGKMRRWQTRAHLVLENILEPLALPATGGLVVALLVFGMVYQVLGVGMPLAAATPDLPNNLLQPARVETLARFQMSGLAGMSRSDGQHSLLIEAIVNAEGEATSYRVLSGALGPAERRELDQVVLFSRFRPQMTFGRPMSGGRVILSFSQILVRG